MLCSYCCSVLIGIRLVLLSRCDVHLQRLHGVSIARNVFFYRFNVEVTGDRAMRLVHRETEAGCVDYTEVLCFVKDSEGSFYCSFEFIVLSY
jgi:hypothetical protein